jgi:predicted glycoside hydrolase/deacetylase ChbG (UPF0249 family)
VGIHLNLVRGRPLSSPGTVTTLVDGNGRFFTAMRLARRLLLGLVAEPEIERELDAQVQRVRGAGIAPTHLDTEKHMHMFPPVLRGLVAVAHRHGIGQVRWGAQTLGLFALLTRQGWKALAKGLLSMRSEPLLRASGLRHAHRFAGLLESGRLDARACLRLIAELPEGVTELACHPGYVDDELSALARELGPTYIDPCREQELRALTAPEVAAACRERGVRLAHYGELRALLGA